MDKRDCEMQSLFGFLKNLQIFFRKLLSNSVEYFIIIS